MQNSHAMPARGKFCCGDEYVRLSPGQRTESFMDIEKVQSNVSLRKMTRVDNRANP